ncbi:hypothetical protein C461_00217 [Halorubrum aidingense JCM 13560]|uniref:Uncharacterized protein n=1 Tax=Halorubrum aidingense JCM 13560 TaxID=1230454 RepID=M0PKR9_9EURY|nr:hypothetical protein [Halorubrum aidingense]EMA70666.1 hypothetical protein C461_00217 [Halorubrum aidingense JCM 13560]
MPTKSDWRDAPRDPDTAVDLGYDLLDLDVLPTSIEGQSRLIVLPAAEEQFHEDAFLVVNEELVCDLGTMV